MSVLLTYTTSSSFDSFLKLMVAMVMFIFVLVVTYLVTRWIGNYQKIKYRSGNLQIIETIPAGNNKMICLVKAGTKYLVVSIGKDEIHLLSTLSEEELTDIRFLQEDENSVAMNDSFAVMLEKIKEKMPKK